LDIAQFMSDKIPIPTKVYKLQIERTDVYCIYVEAESTEQAKAAWEENNYEASGCLNLRDRTTRCEEELTSVVETDRSAEECDFDYYNTCQALGLEVPEEE
jgi:hypothetical protein